MADLPLRSRIGLALQRGIGHALGLVWIPLVAFVLRFVMRYRIRDADEVRQRFRTLVEDDDRPVLLCPNHLTMIDSAVVAWALGGSWWYLTHYSHLPWNVPERQNFASNVLNRFVAWITKCIPVTRGGEREEVASAMDKLRYLLERGETALVFPEGGRSRTGRVEPDSATYGVGRILTAVPRCRTVVVYLRGDHQESWSTVPPRGDVFSVDFQEFEPRSEESGLRRARDLARQITHRLRTMEEAHFAGR